MAERRPTRPAGEHAAGVPARLAELLTRNEWSVAQMAEKCGVSRSALDKYIRGDQQPGLEAIISICLGADVSPTWLLLGYSDDTNLSDTHVVEPVPLQALDAFVHEESVTVLRIIAGHLETCASLKEVHLMAKKMRQQWPQYLKARIMNRIAEFYIYVDQHSEPNASE